MVFSTLMFANTYSYGQSEKLFSGVKMSDSLITIPFRLSGENTLKSDVIIFEKEPGHYQIVRKISPQSHTISYDFASLNVKKLKTILFGDRDLGIMWPLSFFDIQDSLTLYIVRIGGEISYQELNPKHLDSYQLKLWCPLSSDSKSWTPLASQSSDKFNQKSVGLCFCAQNKNSLTKNDFNFSISNDTELLFYGNEPLLLIYGKSIELLDLK